MTQGGLLSIGGDSTTTLGDGGSAGDACESAAGTQYRALFYPENKRDIEQDVHPFFELESSTGEPVPLNRVKLRYYYTKEADAAESGACFWVSGDQCALVRFSFSDLAPATALANRVMEIAFVGGNEAVLGIDSVEVRVGFNAGHLNLRQSNDYSFDAASLVPTTTTPFPYRAWPRVTLYIDDELVWGTEPCAD